VLNIIDRMAAGAQRRAGVVLDEFQQIVEEGGATAERQIRGTVQEHGFTNSSFKIQAIAVERLPDCRIAYRPPRAGAIDFPQQTRPDSRRLRYHTAHRLDRMIKSVICGLPS
jgi:hypothetical protein